MLETGVIVKEENVNFRVEHFENLVFAITSKMLKILTEHIEKVCSLESKLLLISICSIRILNILDVIAKTSFSKIEIWSTLIRKVGRTAPRET